HIFFFSLVLFVCSWYAETPSLSLHDALPICHDSGVLYGTGRRGSWLVHVDVRGQRSTHERHVRRGLRRQGSVHHAERQLHRRRRSEEHTSELQSHLKLVCRLLLEKKKKPT